MKSFIILTFLLVILYINTAKADCTNAAKADDGEVTAFFKNLGCKIKEGANDAKEALEPYAEKVSTSAKEFGNTVSQKFDEIKHKITDDKSESTPASAPIKIEPTEKVPLAPIGDGPPSATIPATGERIHDEDEVTPESIDRRFLLQPRECPRGQAIDHHNICRPMI